MLPDRVPTPGPALHAAAESRRCMRRLFSLPSYQAADRSFQLPVAFCWALGGESDNVTFLIRLYVRNTARSCACLALFNAKKRSFGGRIHQRAIALACACAFVLFVCATAVARLTIGWKMAYAGCWVPHETLRLQWHTGRPQSCYLECSSRHPGPLKSSAVPQKW